jgi:Tfp pilus assembly protein PilV
MSKFMLNGNRDKKNEKNRGDNGFTLLETAVASLIILVGLVSTANLFVLAALNNQASKQTTLATTIAKRKMENLLSLPLAGVASAPVAYSGSMNATTGALTPAAGCTENYFVDFDRSITTPNSPNGGTANVVTQKGTNRIQVADPNLPNGGAFYQGQPPTYQVSWVVLPDNAATPLPGLRRIIVRAIAVRGAKTGNARTEEATISTIRTPAT